METTEDIWADFRERLRTLVTMDEWSQARLSRTTGVKLQTINTFLQRPRAGLNAQTHAKLRPVVDSFVPPEKSSIASGKTPTDPLPSPGARDRLIPVVDLDDFDFSEGLGMDARLEAEAVFHLSIPAARKGRDVIFRARAPARLRRVSFLAGDLVLIDRRGDPKPGGVAIVSIGRRGFLVDVNREGQDIIYTLPSGDRIRDCRLVGTARYRLEDLTV